MSIGDLTKRPIEPMVAKNGAIYGTFSKAVLTPLASAVKIAVERASKTLRDLRVAEVISQDLVIEEGKVSAYRTKLSVSFKYTD